MARKSDEAILSELRDVAADLTAVNKTRDALYRDRKRLFAAGRRRGIWFKTLGDAAGVTEVATINALRPPKKKPR